MGEEDMRRQRLNVYRMELLGARVVPVAAGTRTLKDATNEALRDWVANVTTTHYILGSAVGPDPFPRMVRDFQSVIGREARAQVVERYGRLPRTVVAVSAVGRTTGMFSAFLTTRAPSWSAWSGGEGVETTRTRRPQPGHARRVPRSLFPPGRGWAGAAGPFGVGFGLDYPGWAGARLPSGPGIVWSVTDNQAHRVAALAASRDCARARERPRRCRHWPARALAGGGWCW
jgi:tryptophan synthase beta chain